MKILKEIYFNNKIYVLELIDNIELWTTPLENKYFSETHMRNLQTLTKSCYKTSFSILVFQRMDI